MQGGCGSGVGPLGQGVQDVGDLVHPAALLDRGIDGFRDTPVRQIPPIGVRTTGEKVTGRIFPGTTAGAVRVTPLRHDERTEGRGVS